MLRTSLTLTLALSPALQAQTSPLPPQRTGVYYVSGSNSGNVGEYAPDGTLLRTFTSPDLQGPRGIAVDDLGNLVVNCANSDRILVFDLEGLLIKTVSHPNLTLGTGIARSADGRWYIGNYAPGGVLVFDAEWNYIETISDPAMAGVNCVAFDDDGSFTVTDAVHAQLHRFDAGHQYLGMINHSSLSSPMSIAKDSYGDHYVSNGGGGRVTKFDANWSYLMTFGLGTLSAPQGIVIDEHDELTITNFSAQTVHRYGTDGILNGSFPLVGITTGRNICWQTSSYALAREGTVDAANGLPVRILTANGQTGDSMGRMDVSMHAPLVIEMQSPPAGPASAPLVLYGRVAEPTLFESSEMPRGFGLFAFSSPLVGGHPMTLVNSIGHNSLLGTGRFPSVHAPGTLLSFPSGVGRSMTWTLQALVRDDGSEGAGFSVSNTLVLHIQ
ncbi:MAG: sugar lactone lactonase YvrE [Candidatus Paceibacteria bacterium]|jgi:sugar lactone lactonase YvrE